MQLKGLVRFFTILLIVYSLYQLSFTLFVRKHEKKMEAIARTYVKENFKTAAEKYPNPSNSPALRDSQAIYQETLDKAYQERLKRILDSTKDVTVTYGINGSVSYQKAKSEELNLGLDLQGGMNVTLEVEMSGLLKSLANNTKDSNFLSAIANADKRKANSDANFISLFIEEYRKLEPNRPLASLFAIASSEKIDVKSTDGQVEKYIRDKADEAFSTTFDRLSKRIDQFGVAQPNITKNPSKGIINVELPGVKDKERVRSNLQSTANLEFWELYTAEDEGYVTGWNKTFEAFSIKYGGAKDTAAKKDTTNKTDTAGKTAKIDTSKTKADILSKKLGTNTDTAGNITPDSPETGVTFQKYFEPSGFQPYEKNKEGKNIFPAAVGTVSIKDTALVMKYLEEYKGFFPGDVVFTYGTLPKDKNGRSVGSRVSLYGLKTNGSPTAKLDGDAVSSARQTYDQFNKVEITMEMTKSGRKIWGDMTTKNVGRPIAIVLDNIVQTAPNVITAITDGTSSISGNYSQPEAADLSKILEIGKLPAPAKIVQEQQVGPTLGQKALEGGAKAFIISFIVIFLLMLVYYNTSGWVANIALILNLLFTVGVLSGLGATLTAPGIAGLVLTIGMAVDTNVIIYERIKEELSRGKGYIPSINEGYKKSLPPVLDAHITVLLTSIILFSFGLGPVKGFATTQIIGILLSLFCGILVSRWITEWFTNKKKHLEYFTGVSRRVFKHAKFKFIEYRKVAYVISMIVLALGIASYFNGFDYGVEFNGGRNYRIGFGKPVDDVEKVRTDLRNVFGGENPVIKTIGDNATLDITTSYLIDNTSKATDSIVENKLMAGLKNYLPADLTFEQFDKQYKQKSDKVLPTISDDLKRGAIKATVFAMLVIFLYIFIRFRDWRYSLGTIVALLHDVFVTLAVFSFARSIVPFPLEIDQHFIAAILTVIGFSMNDTVIVFDRIREYSKLMPNSPRGEVINKAINETLSRTIMTSLTVFLTILILFLVGGEVTKGFAFAMLIGVITGTYSSIFVAAPILVDLGGKRGLGKKAVVEKPNQGMIKPKS
jgi:SecD/SecF fusion protein